MNLHLPRMTQYVIFALLLFAFIGYFSPENLPVVIYKLGLVTGAGFVGYWLDRHLFPYGRPDRLLLTAERSFFGFAMIRRAIIVAAVVVGFALAL